MKLTSLTTLLSVGILFVPAKTFAFDFQMGADETVILNDDFETGAGWQLSSQVEISEGVLTHKDAGSYGRASYTLETPLSLNNGAISLYWLGAFPDGAHRERDAYWPSLQYADNPAVCWDSSTHDVVDLGADGQCGSGYIRVDEDSELRVWLRPKAPTTFNRLYIDQGFIPGKDPEKLDSPLAQLSIPNHPDPAAGQYRLKLEQTDGIAAATLSYWNGSDWQSLNARSGSSLPLLIDASDWITIDGTIQAPIFEALNFQFRGPGPNDTATGVSAVALTQALNSDPAQSVPEPSSVLGLMALMGIGFRQKQKSS